MKKQKAKDYEHISRIIIRQLKTEKSFEGFIATNTSMRCINLDGINLIQVCFVQWFN